MPSEYSIVTHEGTHGYEHHKLHHTHHQPIKDEYEHQWSTSSTNEEHHNNRLFILSPPFDVDSPKQTSGHSRAVSPNSVQVSTPFASFPMETSASQSPVVTTPLTRFLTKQNLGYIPKSSYNESNTTKSFYNGTSQGLPSLSNTLTSSPYQTKRSFSSQNQSFSSTPLNGHSSLPPLKRTCTSPQSPLPSISSMAVCPPLRYFRSQSCPSDTMVQMSAGETDDDVLSPLAQIHRHEHRHQVFQQEHRHQMPLYPQPQMSAPFPKGRLCRSSSLNVDREMCNRLTSCYREQSDYENSNEVSIEYPESVNCQSWIGRNPLASLATESTHRWQQMKDNQRHQQNGETTSRSQSEGDEQDDGEAEIADDDEVENVSAARRLDLSEPRRDKKLCAYADCQSNAVTRGLCISHGGGRRCQLKGCTRGAQSKGLCVAHGGGRICREKGCSNIQRSMGLCIRHGGGKRCSVSGCEKGVVRQDLCTAHGGKRKCRVNDCNKHVKRKGLCRSHANSMLSSDGESTGTNSLAGIKHF